MSALPQRTVAVVDPIWVGHHPMYFAQFAASFLRHGARVIAICPDPADARRELAGLTDEATVAGRVVFRKLDPAQRSLFGGRFEGDPLTTAARWRRASRVLEDAEKECGYAADLVYFPYLDTYLRFLPASSAPEILLGRRWSGLYLRNHHFGNPETLGRALVHLGKGDAILRSPTCLGIGVLDERFIPRMEEFTGKPVRAFPDFTNMVMPDVPTALAADVLLKAAGRPIVGIIGLERRKGILTLLRAAELSHGRNLPVFFACGGRIFPSEYTPAEWQWIESLAGGKLPNLHLDLSAGRIPSEAEFNSLFSTFGIAWAAYENFPGSSNTLVKAASLGIPCLASEGGCVGERVRKFGTGVTIPEGDAEGAVDAIQRLAGDPPKGRYDALCEEHSVGRLDRLLGDLLAELP